LPPLLVALLAAALADTSSAPASLDTTRSTLRDTSRVVRRFPAIEVSAGRIHDMRSSATVHTVSAEALRDLPLSSLAQALALQPGVVAVGEDLHVRGGRAGETQWTVNGLVLNEPLHDQAPEIPLLAVQRADLLAGGLDAEYAGALAGVLDVRTWNPTATPTGAVRWLTTGRVGTAYDWLGARGTAPLLAGLGVAAAGEARLEDSFLPGRPARGRDGILGRRFGWRNDNHLLGWAKLAPIENPQAASLEVFTSRRIEEPYDPMFSWNDSLMIYTLTPGPGETAPPVLDSMMVFYRASDHQPLTESRRWNTLAQVARLDARLQWRVSLAWQHGSTLTSPGLERDPRFLLPAEKLRFGQDVDPERDPFHAYQGEWAYFKRTRFDRLQAAVTGSYVASVKQRVGWGAGAQWDDALLYELDAVEPTDSLIDPVRTFHTRAPGGWAYVQHRYEHEGLVWNGGLRLQMFDAGSDARAPAGTTPTGVLPDTRPAGKQWTVSPRLGLAFPLTVRDAMSVSYARIHQPPGREYLSDNRLLVYSRRPLGDPRLVPSELVTYQVGVKHLFNERWALQMSLFHRDLYGQIGIVNEPYYPGTFRPRYANAEYGHATGFEFALLAGARRADAPPTGGPILRRLLSGEFSLRYTHMNAYGTLSGTDGWAYGTPFGFRPIPLGEHPLDWDREHLLGFDAVWREPRVLTFAWVTQLASEPRWTPTVAYAGLPGGPRVAPDLAAVNSRTLPGSARTDVALRLEPPALHGAKMLIEVRNLFNARGEAFVSVPGFPNPDINTLRDDYAGYRTDTKNGGGAYWDPRLNGGQGGWVPVDDARLRKNPRSIRLGIEVGL
jgi:outer membrane receptor protein involved in Fe transport